MHTYIAFFLLDAFPGEQFGLPFVTTNKLDDDDVHEAGAHVLKGHTNVNYLYTEKQP